MDSLANACMGFDRLYCGCSDKQESFE